MTRPSPAPSFSTARRLIIAVLCCSVCALTTRTAHAADAPIVVRNGKQIAGKVVIDGLLHGILSEVIKNRRSDQRDDLREGLEKAVQVAAHPQRLLEDFDSLEFDWTPPSRTGFRAAILSADAG